MDVTRRDLHQNWAFAFAPHRAVNTPAECAGLTFHPAAVPGTNLTDLQAARLVEPDTSPSYEDSFAPYKRMDFVYRTRFAGGAEAGRRVVRLCCEGLDTVCELWLNGERIGAAENCHLAYSYNLKGVLRPGENELVLLFRSPIAEADRRQRESGLRFPGHLGLNYMFLRKPAYSFFWDWGPQIPVSGVYRPISLQAYDRAEISDWQLRYTIHEGDVEGKLQVQAPEADGAQVRMSLGDREWSAAVQDGVAVVPFRIPGARLWYPNGEGEPALYDLAVTLSTDGVTLDRRDERVGFRTIELLQDERRDGRGTRYLFRVNGKELFCRGYNWIPVDNSVPRGDPELYRRNLDLAQAGNANMLRIWGGGYYEDDLFYRLCDERGLLVWQDGAFACTLYPDTDPAFMGLVRDELAYNIKRLRHHPSLALWCGENENHWGYEDWWKGDNHHAHFYGSRIYDEMYPALVRELDPDRLYWNGSPWSPQPGVRANDPTHGDTHFWDLHSACGDLAGYRDTAPSFVSETGIQSMPDLRTALTIGGPDDQHVQSFVMDTRNHFENPAKNDRVLKFTAALFRVSGDFNQSVVATHRAHGEYMKYAVEHWRSQAYDCAGVLVWQINDCWPAISWAVVDYHLAPKGCFYYLKRAYASDLVGYVQHFDINYAPEVNAVGDLFVASERDGVKQGQVDLRVLRVTGEVLEKSSYPVRMEGRGAVALGPVRLAEYAARRFDCVAEFTLRWDDGGGARNVYTLSRPKHMHLPEPHIALRQVDSDTLVVSSDLFAKGVYLFHPDAAIVFDDNYFDLLPGEERVVHATGRVDVGQVRAMAYHH